jgi:hypothetical protein
MTEIDDAATIEDTVDCTCCGAVRGDPDATAVLDPPRGGHPQLTARITLCQQCARRVHDQVAPRAESILQALRGRLRAAERWIDDLHSGMWINCVYCGHCYGPRHATPATLPEAREPAMADALRQHIAQCPAHPMSGLLAAARHAESVIDHMMLMDGLTGVRLGVLQTCSGALAEAIAQAQGEGRNDDGTN